MNILDPSNREDSENQRPMFLLANQHLIPTVCVEIQCLHSMENNILKYTLTWANLQGSGPVPQLQGHSAVWWSPSFCVHRPDATGTQIWPCWHAGADQPKPFTPAWLQPLGALNHLMAPAYKQVLYFPPARNSCSVFGPLELLSCSTSSVSLQKSTKKYFSSMLSMPTAVY